MIIKKILNLLGESTDDTLTIDMSQIDSKNLLSNKPGRYTVKELLAELSIRENSMSTSNIKFTGMTLLQNCLLELSLDATVHNYIFKAENKTLIAYLNEDESEAIGVLVIET